MPLAAWPGWSSPELSWTGAEASLVAAYDARRDIVAEPPIGRALELACNVDGTCHVILDGVWLTEDQIAQASVSARTLTVVLGDGRPDGDRVLRLIAGRRGAVEAWWCGEHATLVPAPSVDDLRRTWQVERASHLVRQYAIDDGWIWRGAQLLHDGAPVACKMMGWLPGISPDALVRMVVPVCVDPTPKPLPHGFTRVWVMTAAGVVPGRTGPGLTILGEGWGGVDVKP